MPKAKGLSASLIIFMLIIISGCDSQICCTNIDTGFNLFIVDQNGDDLLDQTHPNAITKSNTDLYYLVDGEIEKKYASRNFSIQTEEKQFERYAMRISTSNYEGGVAEILYLEFEDESMDTIKVQHKKSGNSTYLTHIWYNGELRWDVDDKSLNEHPDNEYVGRYFTVTHNVN